MYTSRFDIGISELSIDTLFCNTFPCVCVMEIAWNHDTIVPNEVKARELRSGFFKRYQITIPLCQSYCLRIYHGLGYPSVASWPFHGLCRRVLLNNTIMTQQYTDYGTSGFIITQNKGKMTLWHGNVFRIADPCLGIRYRGDTIWNAMFSNDYITDVSETLYTKLLKRLINENSLSWTDGGQIKQPHTYNMKNNVQSIDVIWNIMSISE